MKLSASQNSAITEAIRDAFDAEQLSSWLVDFQGDPVEAATIDEVVAALISVCEEVDNPLVWPLLFGALCKENPTNEKLAALARDWSSEDILDSADENEGTVDPQLEAARPPRPTTPPTMPPTPIKPPAPTPSPVFPPPKPAPQPVPAPAPNPVKPGPGKPVPLPPVPAPRPVKPAKPQQQE